MKEEEAAPTAVAHRKPRQWQEWARPDSHGWVDRRSRSDLDLRGDPRRGVRQGDDGEMGSGDRRANSSDRHTHRNADLRLDQPRRLTQLDDVDDDCRLPSALR